MRRLKIEKIKTLLIIILIFTSVLQVGIHWSLQAQGFPFRFITQLFPPHSDKVVDVDVRKDNYFKPENITVSISSDQWILPKEQKYYRAIWNDIKLYYIPSFYAQKPSKVLPKSDWQTILNETCTRIDFSTRFPNDLITWFENVKPTSNQGFSGIKSIAILPQKDVNETVNTVYVYDEENVYMFNVSIKQNALPKQYYMNLPEVLKEQEEILSTTTIGELYPKLAINPSIPIQLDLYSTMRMQAINISLPEALTLSNENIGNVQETILLSQKDSLMAALNKTSAVFSDTENVYKLDSNGLLEYSYLPSIKEEVSNIKDSFTQAISFIELRKDVLQDVEIVLSGIEPADDGYIFTFDYEIDGYPILFSELKGNDIVLTSAITIRASSQRILYCRWAFRTFSPDGQYVGYMNSFVDLVENKLSINNANILKNERFESIEEGYVFDLANRQATALYPNWILKTNAGWYTMPLSEEE